MGSGDSLGVPSSQKNSEPRVITPSTPHLLNGIAPCTEFLVLPLSFEKMRTNEKSQTRHYNSHLLQQLGLRPLHVGTSAG